MRGVKKPGIRCANKVYALRIFFRFLVRKSAKSSTRLRFIAGYVGIARRDRWHLLTFQGIYRFHSKTLRNLSATRVDMLIKPTRVLCTFSQNVADECQTHDCFPSQNFLMRLIHARFFSDRLHATACHDDCIAIDYLLTSEMFH